MSKPIRKTAPSNLAAALSLSLAAGLCVTSTEPALADGMRTRYRHAVVHHYYHLPPERHVIEGVRPPGSGIFLINGRYFAAASPTCGRWVAGDRIRLLAGDWHGYCDVAVFRNLQRGGTCRMWCPS